MSDKQKLEKFLKNFVAGEREAAGEYLAQVIASKTKRLVNEAKGDNKVMDDSKPEVKELKGVGDTKAKPLKKVNTKEVPGKNKPKAE